MKRVITYIVIPFFLSLITTFIALVFLVTIYYPDRLGKYEIAGYCVLIYIIAHAAAVGYNWLFIELPKIKAELKQLLHYNLGQDKTLELIEYIQQYELTKVYVSRDIFNAFFKKLTITRIAPRFYYSTQQSVRICLLKIDPHLDGFQFNSSKKTNWIININDLYK